MNLSADIIKGYNATRHLTNKAVLCHAPFVNLNFEQNGNVRACCYNSTHILGIWPQNTIKEIWQGEQAELLRSYIRDKNLGGGCARCGDILAAGNYQGVRAKYYDEFESGSIPSRINKLLTKLTGAQVYPKIMEFELSNTCNLECVMCNGYFSSSIRKNREQLPPINSVYNDTFVDELEEFIPHLTDARFLGGEPFMIDIYLKIWERILKIKPGIRIHITTNGTFLNNRIKDLLEGLNAGIIMSVDSVNPDTYKKIRVNGNFDKVMENLEYFRDYTKRKKTFLSLAACPITYNWHELPSLLEFCIEKDIMLYFNMVFRPKELSLREQSTEYLQQVINTLEKYEIPSKKGVWYTPANISITAYADFIKQLRGWLVQDKYQYDPLPEVNINFVKETVEEWSLTEIKELLQEFTHRDGYVSKETLLVNRLANLFMATPNGKLADVIICYFDIYTLKTAINTTVEMREKAFYIASMIERHPSRDTILLQMSTASPIELAEILYTVDVSQLEKMLEATFSM